MIELPDSWEDATFDDVAVVAANLVQPQEFQELPHIAPNHIASGTGQLLPYATIAEDGVTSAKHLFEPGHILYSKIRPYLAKVVHIDFAGLCSADMYPVHAYVAPRFLFRWMLGSTFTELASRSQGRTVLPKINKKALGVLRVPVPPLNEQKRIVTKIDALTDKSREAREALDEVPDLLDKLRQSILAAAFRGDLTSRWREQNPDVEPASVLLDRIRKERRTRWEEAELAKMRAKGKVPKDDNWKAKYKEPEPVDAEGLPELPEGWCWASVGSLCTAVADGVHKKPHYVDSGVPFVTVRNMTAAPGISFENLNYITQEDHEEYIKRTHPEKGDVLISKDGTLGVVRLIETDRVFSIFVSVAVMKPAVSGFGRHLATMLETPQVQGLLVTTGTGLKHIHLKDLRATPIPIPPVSEQQAIQEEVQRLTGLVESQQRAVQSWGDEVARLDASILAKAFRGELVPQDPHDEPASVLLERIRAEREAAAPKKKRASRKKAAKK